jgi:hydroxymethylbilane synthase
VAAHHLRIGTRGSALALWQANWVADRLRELGATVELVEITTSGDREQRDPILEMNQQGVFTKEVQAAVFNGEADIAVHSLKDLPTETVEGLLLAAVPERESCNDVLVSRVANSLAELPTGARVGTGSLRRQAQLRSLRGDLEIVGIRGNVDTRLFKLAEGDYDAIILAAAGLNRLKKGSGLFSSGAGRMEQKKSPDPFFEELAPPRMLPAPGQGALGIECHREATEVLALVSQLEHPKSRAATDAERSMLAMLHAGCSAPVGSWGRIEDGELVLDGLVASLDGKQVLRASGRGAVQAAVQLGQGVAEELLAQGAGEIIQAARFP